MIKIIRRCFMKKVIASTMVFGSLLYADYTMVYQMHDPEDPKNATTSTFYYKDAQHARVDMKQKGKTTASSMLVKGNKAYMITYENGKPQVIDMDAMMKMAGMFGGGMSEGGRGETQEEQDGWEKVEWRKTGKYKILGGIKGEIWKVTDIEDGKKKTHEIVVTDDSDYIKAVHAYEGVMKRMVDGGGDVDTKMFTMIKKGYAPIEIDGGQMRLRSFSEKNVDKGLFELPKGAQVQKSPFGGMFGGAQGNGGEKGSLKDKCYSELCCGQTQGASEVLSKMVAPSAEGYTLEGSAICDSLGLGSLFGINSVEGALYKKGDKSVTVTLDTDAKDKGTVLKTRDAEQSGTGMHVTGYKSGFIGEYRYYYAVLQPMNVQQLDIVMDSHTLLSFSHRVEQGKVPMVKFAKEAIDFDAYSPAASKKKPQQKEKAASSTSDDDADDTKKAINKGVDEAVDVLKSLF